MVYLESEVHPRLDLDEVNCYPSSIKGVQGFTTGYIPIGIQAEPLTWIITLLDIRKITAFAGGTG